MKKFTRLLLSAMAITSFALATPIYAQPSVILEYTGNTFDEFQEDGPTTPQDTYDDSDSVTGWVELPAALDANMVFQVVTPLSFEFSDGINTFNDSSDLTHKLFFFSTDENGLPISWEIFLRNFVVSAEGGGTKNSILSFNLLDETEPEIYDLGEDILCGPESVITCYTGGDSPFYISKGYVRDDAGAWSYRALDSDDDGIADNDDYCPETSIPEGVPTKHLGKLRFALVDYDGIFDTTPTGGKKGPNRNYTIVDTAGCSCEQILDALGFGEDRGQLMFGCAISVMDEWVEFVIPSCSIIGENDPQVFCEGIAGIPCPGGQYCGDPLGVCEDVADCPGKCVVGSEDDCGIPEIPYYSD